MAPQPGKSIWKERDGTTGFQGLAAILSERYSIVPPLDRRQVWLWWSRGTKNAAGEHFPTPVKETRESPTGVRVSRWFDIEQVATWYSRGVPGLRRKGWKYPSTAGRESAKL